MKDTIIYCKFAIEAGYSKEDMIKSAEAFFGCRYFQEYYEWDAKRYPYLHVRSEGKYRVVGSDSSQGKTVVDWHSVSILHAKLRSTFDKAQGYNEELL